MFEADKREFAEILRATLDLYGKEASAPVLRLWWASLEKFSIEEVRHGFSRFIQSPDNGSFYPKPADIIRMIEGTAGDRGMIAWGKVQEAIVRVGGYQSVAFDDPIIHACIEDMGGWPKLCTTDRDDMPFRAADFAKRYRAYVERGAEVSVPYLVGRSETENRLNGYKPAPPVLIGDPQKAALLIGQGRDTPRLQITSGKNLGQLLGEMKLLE